MTIRIEIAHGSEFVADEDIDRAEAAAMAVLNNFEWSKGDPMEIDPQEAYFAYQRHMSDEEYFRSPRETVLIAAWKAAESAADIALTEGWHNTAGAHCYLSA